MSVTRYLPGRSKVCFGWAVTSGMPSLKSQSRSTIAPAARELHGNSAGSPARIDSGTRKSATGGGRQGLGAGNRSSLLPSTLQSVNSSAVYCEGPATAARPLPVIAQRSEGQSIHVPAAQLHAVAAVAAEAAVLEDHSAGNRRWCGSPWPLSLG